MSIIAQQWLYRPNSELYNTQMNVKIPLLKAWAKKYVVKLPKLCGGQQVHSVSVHSHGPQNHIQTLPHTNCQDEAKLWIKKCVLYTVLLY